MGHACKPRAGSGGPGKCNNNPYTISHVISPVKPLLTYLLSLPGHPSRVSELRRLCMMSYLTLPCRGPKKVLKLLRGLCEAPHAMII